MDHPTSWETLGIAGLVLGILALLVAGVSAVRVHRMRAAQTAVLGDHGNHDLVRHASVLEARVRTATADWEAQTRRLDARMAGIEGALLRVFSRHGMVRYDAYGEQSGHQSCSLAMLDVRGDGVVITSIHHRDQARVYVRRVTRGKPEHRLAPEEEEALATALGNGAIDPDGTVEGIAPASRGTDLDG